MAGGPCWAAAPPFEKVLPDDVVVWINVRNVPTFTKQLRQSTPLGVLFDPAMKPFVKRLAQTVKDIAAKFGPLHATVLEKVSQNQEIRELAHVPSGQFAMALSLSPVDPRQVPTAYLLVDVSGHEERLATLIEQGLTILSGAGIESRKEEGVTILDFQRGAAEGTHLCFELKGAVLIVSNFSSAVRQVGAALDKQPETSLATSEVFVDFRSQEEAPADVEFFVSLKGLIAPLTMANVPGGEVILKKWNLDTLQSTGMLVWLDTKDFHAKWQSSILKRGDCIWFDLVQLPMSKIVAPKWVPKDVVQFAVVNWDFKVMLETLRNSGLVTPEAFNGFTAALMGPDPAHPVIDFHDDIVESFGTQITMLFDLFEDKGIPARRVLVAWELKNPKRVEAAVGRVIEFAKLAKPELIISERKVNDITIYAIDNKNERNRPAPRMGVQQPASFGTLGIAVYDGNLMVASHIEFLEAVFKSKEGIGEFPQYQKGARLFPEKTSSIDFQNGKLRTRDWWAFAKDGRLATFAQPVMMNIPNGGMVVQPLLSTLEELPKFDVVEKYFPDIYTYYLVDERGFRAVRFIAKD